ncbi:MAG: hypothetical protein P8Z80_13305 [Pseudolabrys sp.]|jgi:hypothetical protein
MRDNVRCCRSAFEMSCGTNVLRKRIEIDKIYSVATRLKGHGVATPVSIIARCNTKTNAINSVGTPSGIDVAPATERVIKGTN